MKMYLISLLACLTVGSLMAQTKMTEIPLYEKEIPNNQPGPDQEKSETTDGILRISQVRNPTLTVFLPKKANGTSVVICPGGGYWIIAASHEGYDVARKFNEMGVTAFVLKYRLPDAAVSPQPEIAPLQDAQQALRVVRKRAKEWNVDPQKVGMMGFSAGGHLASTAGTHFDKARIDNPENLSLRPDFLMLIYPVITADPAIAHSGSFNKLLGANPTPEKLEAYSNEKQITPQTPPTFLVHASDDSGVSSLNSVVFYQALLKNKVPAEMHLYQGGEHGFGMINRTTRDLWMERCRTWMESIGFLPKAVGSPSATGK